MTRNLLWAASALVFLATQAARGGSVPDGFTFAAGGDLIGPFHTLQGVDDPAFFQGVVPLFRTADVGFANQEGSVFDLKTFAGAPAAENGGGIPLSPTVVARDLKAMGISLMSKANNHATDWGTEGLVETLRNLTAAGVVYAGAGHSDMEARSPGYLVTDRGKAALVDTASTFPTMAAAGAAQDRRGEMTHTRAGISILQVEQIHLLPPADLIRLRDIVGSGFGGGEESAADEVRVGDVIFRAAEARGSVWEMSKEHENSILAGVREARRNADFVLFSIHAHETGGESATDPRPASFEPVLFHDAIDAGADAVVRNGPHVLNGIEIYKGKPIFYSLGSLFFDFRLPSRSHFTPDWYETIVPVVTYKGGKASEIRLYPMVIDSSMSLTGGAPHPAPPERAQQILERLKTMSAAFGTEIRIENNVGIIRPGG